MHATDVRISVAALLERCAQQRAGVIPARYQDDPAQLTRMLQAEAAGRELMAALVLPDPYPAIGLGAVMRRLIGYIQTVITASTPEEELAPLLTVRAHHVTMGTEGAGLLRDAAILLVLAAYDDGASDVDVRLSSANDGARLIVESDQPGMTADVPALLALRGSIAACGGSWEATPAPHGSSWLVHISLPMILTRTIA